MDLTQQIDIYCERLGPGLTAEPLNAITNLAFVVAAVWAWRLARQRGVLDGPILLLVGLAAAVGTGSFLFHTFATRWAGIADVIPIQIFALSFAFIAFRRLLKLGPAAAILLLTAVIIAFVVGASVLTLPSFQGSIMYAPTLISLTGLTTALATLRRPAWRIMAAATTTLAMSLTLRSYDNAICADFPTGTHFVWHLLNGLLFALLLRAIIVHGTVPTTQSAAPSESRRLRLLIEFGLIYLVAPVATKALVMTGDLSARLLPLGLAALLVLALVLLFLTPGVSWRRAFGGRLIADWPALLLFTAITLAAI
jgi:hypothetical protein